MDFTGTCLLLNLQLVANVQFGIGGEGRNRSELPAIQRHTTEYSNGIKRNLCESVRIFFNLLVHVLVHVQPF